MKIHSAISYSNRDDGERNYYCRSLVLLVIGGVMV